MMRRIAGSFAEYEKARLVAKLKAARDRKKPETGKGGGRRSYAEARPGDAALAKQLSGQRMSYRKISATRGHGTATGKAFVASAIQATLGLRRLLKADTNHPVLTTCEPLSAVGVRQGYRLRTPPGLNSAAYNGCARRLRRRLHYRVRRLGRRQRRLV
jgi:hypothetical protein